MAITGSQQVNQVVEKVKKHKHMETILNLYLSLIDTYLDGTFRGYLGIFCSGTDNLSVPVFKEVEEQGRSWECLCI